MRNSLGPRRGAWQPTSRWAYWIASVARCARLESSQRYTGPFARSSETKRRGGMKRFIMVTFACVPALLATACSGNGGDQGQATMKEVTTVVNEADVKPVTSDVFSSLKVSGQPCSLDSIDGDYASKLGLIKGETHVFRGWLANHVR